MQSYVLCMIVLSIWTHSLKASEENAVQYADETFLLKQKFLLEIVRNIYQPMVIEDYVPYSKNWIADESKYKDYGAASHFFQLYESGFLQKGQTYSIFNYWNLQQTRALFQLFYNSIDWDTYRKNVIWARENTNEGMFICALMLSVIHRRDLQAMELPVVYELNPYLFFNSDLIQDAMVRTILDPEFGFYESNFPNAVFNNYSSQIHRQREDTLAYYTDDIGMNSYYFYYMLEYPAFLGGDEMGLSKDRRGELFLYMHQQMLARYYLERQSNSMGPIEELNWRFPLKTGYHPMLRYWNGVAVRSRENNHNQDMKDAINVQNVLNYEQRIQDTIDKGYYILSNGSRINLRTKEAVEMIGNIINGNVDSIDPDFFKSFDEYVRMILSQSDYYQPAESVWPGPTMHYESSMRDPIFFEYLERILRLYWRYKNYLPFYTYDALNFKGVVIEQVAVDKLVTYFEYFNADISNGLPFKSDGSKGRSTWNFTVFGRQKRLNHKPFNYTLTVQSDIVGKGVVRIYMGPRFNNIRQLQLLKKYYVEMDQYVVDLVNGPNIIHRGTKDYYFNTGDRTTYTEQYKKVLRALDGKEQFELDMSEAHCGWPDRLLLPRGLSSGFDITFFLIISPYSAPKVAQFSTFAHPASCGVGTGSKYIDDLPFGFPFDRKLDVGFLKPKNMIFENVTIYHLEDTLG